MKIFKDEKLPQLDPAFDLNCSIGTSIRLSEFERIANQLVKIEGVRIPGFNDETDC